MNFRNTQLLLHDKNYQQSMITINNYDWIRYDMRNDEGNVFSTYIFNLKYFDAG
jgi:hypothetical protein